MILATFSTRHFDFTALAESESEAKNLLALAWLEHRRQYPDADSQVMYDAINQGDINFVEISLGEVARDGSIILSTNN